MRFLRITGLLLLLLLAGLVLIVQFFGDPIARRVVAALNQQLRTEIVIERSDLSLLRSFPYLSADLRGVTVAGSDGSQLLRSDRLACRLDLSSLFGKVRIRGIVVEHGELYLLTDVDGNPNYLFTAPLEADGDAGAVEFEISEARLADVALHYEDRQLRTEAFLTVTDASFSGDFGARAYTLATDADLFVDYLDQDGYRYLSDETLRLLGQATIDHAAGSYTLTPLRLYAGDFTVEATGVLTPTEDGLATTLHLSSTSGNLEDVFALLPPAYARTLGELETRGDLALTADVAGAWTARTYPRIDGRLTFTDGRLGSPRMNVGARDLNLDATFAYVDGPRGGVQTFAIDQLTGNFRGEPFDLKLRLEDLNDPVITFSADGSLPLTTLPAFLDGTTITDGDGLLRFDGLTLSGRYADMVEPRRMGRVASTGRLTFEDGSLTVNGREIRVPAGDLLLDDNALRVTELRVETGESSLAFTGEATNLVPVLFADSLNSRDATLNFTATLTGDRLDVAEWLALSDPSEKDLETAAGDSTSLDSLGRRAREQRARVTELLNGTFEADIDNWTWDKLEGESFRGQLVFTPGRLAVRGSSRAMEGEFRVDAITDFGRLTRTEARITATDVDAYQFFYQNDNFTQDFLTADNLTGRLNARMILYLYYDEEGNLDYDRLQALAGLEILDGELHDFALLENFAFALKAGDLERVRFTRLANYIEITDGTVYLPAMLVQSSAINLTLSGSHTFDQYLEYYIKVNAGQVIANKISRHDDNLEVLPARNGLFNLYYTIVGPLETYRVETDKQAVKNDFRRSTYRSERIRQTLEERFRTPIELLPRVDDGDLTE
ncbi:AsmA-like C-terminal region-containing protein [Lewinella sp. IMCC34183]|uniref:AsmA-like C-terminal region-containing protein n=1 Tax=Lewinella sp. IMCC34183 TaxID=2248762 RepID=UPI000E220D88|nr:AsmA-like C-terminal region-containing protein [Lewinella sp. IMCC34183]